MPIHKKQIRPLARLHGYWIYQQFLRQAATWPVERRRAYVFEKLKQTLVRAYQGVPFYRERFQKAGFDPARDFQSTEDLARAPILTKADVRGHHHEMIDRRYLLGSVIAHTSGTTGQPMEMRLSEYYVALDYACMFRHWARAGYAFRAPFAAIRSYVPASPDDPLWRYSFWQKTLYMSAYHLKPSNSEAYIRELLRFRPPYIRGYVSSISVLAEYAYPFREQFEFVRGIFTASETLLPSERATIERTFGRKLYDWYGMTEPAVVITERADHDGMEVNWEYGYPELLEADGLQPNERKLIATSLHNPVMPFIRYQTDDNVCLAEAPRADELYPRIRSISGRKDEFFLTVDGRKLPSLNFYSLLQTYREILRFQFIQKSLTEVVLRISLRPASGSPAAVLGRIRGEVMQRLAPDMSLDVEVTEDFLRSPDGKTPTFKRTFALSPSSPAFEGSAGAGAGTE